MGQNTRTKMVERTQVAVIGSGPAGMTAARHLEESDIQYLLVSKESAPGDSKVCGGFIPQPALEGFQLENLQGSHEVYGARLRFPRYGPQNVWFDDCVGVNATRADLGSALTEKIESSTGNMKLGATVTSVDCDNRGCVVTYTLNGNKSRMESELVIDASGSRPVSSKHDGVRPYLSDNEMGYAFQYQVSYTNRETKFPELNSFYFGSRYSPKGYAWIFPRGGDAAVGTGGLLNILRQRNTPLPTYLDRLLRDETSGPQSHNHLKIVKREGALIPLAGVVRPSYGKRLMLAGDAAAHCSPISGEGIHYAMIAGRLASAVAKQCCDQNDFSEENLKSYETRWQKALGSDLKWGRRIQRRFMGSSSGAPSSKFLQSDTALKTVAEMLLGLRAVRSTILRCLPAYIKSRIAFWQ
ncbi:MAG: NAD(P)/FAD-dependent oxidoreductase [Candidatus Thorarchaeota archaeon]